MPDLTMAEAWTIAAEVRAVIDMPEIATNDSTAAEWAAIDEALLKRGIVVMRSDSYGRTPAGSTNTWWVAQHESGFVSGRWGLTQGEIAVCLSLHARDHGPLLWLVPDVDNTIHRRYYPKPSSRKLIFPPTDGPVSAPIDAGVTLFDALGDEWAELAG